LRLAGEGERIGLYGFGAAAHILAQLAGIRTTTRTNPLAEANQALSDLRTGALEGAAVLVP
jgi:D-arabinose 1-dehydrogenase-like Zn-dependent alcohol dehydrogenase